MVYDAARQRIVLFGGDSAGSRRGDTWTWDGSEWTALAPATSPPPRAEHAMAYDAARDRIVLFGGADGVQFLDDTWEFDGQDWQRRTPIRRPWSLLRHAMTYDRARERVVLFGGNLPKKRAAIGASARRVSGTSTVGTSPRVSSAGICSTSSAAAPNATARST